MGIRTPVAGVRGPHDWPDYTIAATALIYEAYSYLSLLISALPEPNTGSGGDFPPPFHYFFYTKEQEYKIQQKLEFYYSTLRKDPQLYSFPSAYI